MTRVVFFLIGLLLTITAILKLWMLMTDPFADLRTATTRPVLWGAVFSELAVICLLLIRTSFAVKWTGSMLLFVIFLVFSLVRIGTGHLDCGCLGAIKTPAYVSALVSISTIVTLLVLSRSKGKSISELIVQASELLWKLPTIRKSQLVGGWLVIVVFCTTQANGIWEHLAVFYNGHRISVESVIAGDRASSQSTSFHIWLHNYSSTPIRILGTKKSCRCVGKIEGDKIIMPGRSECQTVDVDFSASTSKGQRVLFWTDTPGQRFVQVDLYLPPNKRM